MNNQRNPRSRKRRRIVGAAIVIGLLLAYLFVTGDSELEALRGELRARGEKLTVEELAPKRTGREINPNLALNAIVRGDANRPKVPAHPIEAWSYTRPGVVRLAPASARPQRSDENASDEVDWFKVREEVELEREKLEALTAFFKTPVEDMGGDYGDLLNYPPNDFIARRTAMFWLAHAALARIHSGEGDLAFARMSALLNVARYQWKEWTIVNQMIRVNAIQYAIKPTWHGLRSNVWSEDQLARLQKQWSDLDLLNSMIDTLRMERARGLLLFRMIENDPAAFGSIFQTGGPSRNPEQWFERFVAMPLWNGFFIEDDEAFLLRTWQRLIDAALTFRKTQSRQSIQPQLNDHLESVKAMFDGFQQFRYQISSKAIPNVARAMENLIECLCSQSFARTAIALERHRLKHGDYPKALDELVPEYFTQLPVDYMTGVPLRYRRISNAEYLLYSAGLNGRDDGGDPASEVEIEIEKYIIWDGKDAVWPRKAEQP